jgi:hypothetical protein
VYTSIIALTFPISIVHFPVEAARFCLGNRRYIREHNANNLMQGLFSKVGGMKASVIGYRSPVNTAALGERIAMIEELPDCHVKRCLSLAELNQMPQSKEPQ